MEQKKSEDLSLSPHRRRVEAWREWLPTVWQFNAFCTLHFHQAVPLDHARSRLWRFLTDMQRHATIFDFNFYERPWSERIDGVIIPEKIEYSTHYHLLLQIPEYSQVISFYENGPQIWKRISKTGTFYIKEQTDPEEWKKIISYATKESHKDLNYGEMILVRELWHRKTA